MRLGVKSALAAALAFAAVGALAAARATPAIDRALDAHPSLVAAVGCAAIILVFSVSPLLLLAALPSGRIPDPGLGRELLEMAEARGLDLLALRRIARAGKGTIGAFAVGVLPRTRCVFLKGTLAGAPPSDEVRAVFAHELGHLARGHIAWQMLLLCGATLLAAPAAHLRDALPAGPLRIAAMAAPAVVWLVLFAIAARAFETEADAYAAGVLGPGRYAAALSRLRRRCAVGDPASSGSHRRRGVAIRAGILALLAAGLGGTIASLAVELSGGGLAAGP